MDRPRRTCLQRCFGASDQLGVLLGLTIWLTLVIGSSASAQRRDGFEGGEPRWRLWESDCSAELRDQRLVATAARSGRLGEQLDIQLGNGSFAYLIYPLPPAAVIDELQVRVSLRTAAGGTQSFLRVVFPNARDSQGLPLVGLLPGEVAGGGGTWHEITIPLLPTPDRAGEELSDQTRAIDVLLRRQERILRHRYGAQVDLSDPFVDAVVLDLYTGPGQIRLQIDELWISGAVPPTSTVSGLSARPYAGAEVPRWGESAAVEMAGDSISEATQRQRAAASMIATTPRWLQYQGEGVEWLAELGINGLVFDSSPPPNVIAQCQRMGLQMIAPPALDAAQRPILPDPVNAWLLGSALDGREVNRVRELRERLLRLPGREAARPMVAQVLEDYWAYGRLSEILLLPVPQPTTVSGSDESLRVMRSVLQHVDARTQPIASLATQPTWQWLEQKYLAEQLSPISGPELPIYDLLQTRLQMYRALVSGSHGVLFRSQQPLDSGLPGDQDRQRLIAGLCQELELLGPWLRANRRVELPTLDLTDGYRVDCLELPTSRLLIFQSATAGDTWLPPAPPERPLTYRVTVEGAGGGAYRLGRGRAERLATQLTDGHLSLQIPAPSWVECVVLTQDPRVIQSIQATATRLAGSTAAARLEVSEQLVRLAQQHAVAAEVPPDSPLWTQLGRAQSSLNASLQWLRRNRPDLAIADSQSAAHLAADVNRQLWELAMQRWPAGSHSSLTLSPLTMPLHWRSAELTGERVWRTERLDWDGVPVGEKATENRWRVDYRLQNLARSGVEYRSALESPTGPGGVRVLASGLGGQPLSGGYAGATLNLRSPSLPMPSSGLVRLRGSVRTLSLGRSPQTGLLVFDNLGGPGLGMLVGGRSPIGTWETFTCYRWLRPNSPLEVMLELRGEADLEIGPLEVSVMAIDPAPAYPTQPRIPELFDVNGSSEEVARGGSAEGARR